MFHKAVELRFKEGTTIEIKFQTGEIKSYDIANLFEKYPQLEALRSRKLFLHGKLMGAYGIIWNDDLDVETETIYEDGITVGIEKSINMIAANAVMKARSKAEISQSDLARLSGIDQSDISKIERGVSNPSVSTLKRLADAMGMTLNVTIS